MDSEFFTEVPGRIGFGGLASTDPLAYKVYEPDRDRPRHADGRPSSDRRLPVALVQLARVGRLRRRNLRPSVAGCGGRPDDGSAEKVAVAFEFLDKLGVPYFTFHDRDVAPEGRTFSETAAILDATIAEIEAHMARTGMRLLWGTANLFSHPRYAAGAATNPDPEVFAYAAAQVRHMLEATHRLGGANYVLWGGREGYETLLNTDLAREETQLARFLTLVAEHKHRIGFTGTLLHRAEAAGADEASVRLRLGHGRRLPRPLRPGRRVPRQHRGQPRDAGGAQLPSRDRRRDQPRDLRQHRHQPRRPAERLGHRSVPELRGRARHSRSTRSSAQAASRPVASTSTPSCAARAWIGPTCSMPTSAGSTPSHGPSWPRPTFSPPATWPMAGRRYAGWSQGIGAQILGGGLSLAEIEARVVNEGIEPRPRSGGQERLENVVNQGIWSVDARVLNRGVTRPRHRRLDDCHEGGAARRGGRVAAIGSAEYDVRGPRSALERAGPATCGGTAAQSAIRAAVARCAGIAGAEIGAVGLAGPDARGGAPRRCGSAGLRPAILWNDQRTAAECDEIRERVGPTRLIEVTGNDALTGFTAPKLLWVPPA